MRRMMTPETLETAVLGGALLSAGAGGEEWMRVAHGEGQTALARGEVIVIDLTDLPDDALVATVSTVGAPSAHRTTVQPDDRVEAVRTLAAEAAGPLVALMISEATTVNGWIQAASLHLPVVDAAGDGRGHPTVEMGGLGLNDRVTVQTAVAGGRPLRLVVRGTLADTSKILRQAAVQVGGLIACARMPLAASILKERAAVGAVSYQIGLGGVMRANAADPAHVADALAAHTGGTVLATGEVASNSAVMTGGFDIGEIVVTSVTGGSLRLPVVNEYMAAWRGSERLALFPDLLAALSPVTGRPLAVKDLSPGTPVAILHVPHARFPIGEGARHIGNLREVETMSGLVIS